MLNKDEIQMANMLLLLTTYFPGYPPLHSFTSRLFEGRRDFVVIADEGLSLFAEIQNCSAEQLDFFKTKVQEISEFAWDISTGGPGITRITIFSK